MQRTLILPAFLFSGALTAQNACDSIHVEGLQYAPFGDGLHITLNNESTQFLSGPTLDVLDADGDTLVQGVMEFFGLFTGTSLHQAHFAPPPPTPFSGTIRLNYYDENGMITCNFPMTNVDLCPADPCSPLGVFAYQQGGSPVTTDLDWSVTDADNNTVASGVLHIDEASFGFAVTELCLQPGAYTMHMAQAVAAGTAIQVGMTQADLTFSNATSTPLPIGGSVDHPFIFYAQCFDDAQGITTHAPQAPTLSAEGRIVHIATNDGSPLGNLILLDGMGHVARTITTNASSASSDLNGFASGVYILRSLDAVNTWPAQRFILN
jgi:hypothetical protein